MADLLFRFLLFYSHNDLTNDGGASNPHFTFFTLRIKVRITTHELGIVLPGLSEPPLTRRGGQHGVFAYGLLSYITSFFGIIKSRATADINIISTNQMGKRSHVILRRLRHTYLYVGFYGSNLMNGFFASSHTPFASHFFLTMSKT